MPESNCAIIGCNSSKKHKLVLDQAQSGERNYTDQQLGGSWLVDVLFDFMTMTSRSFSLA